MKITKHTFSYILKKASIKSHRRFLCDAFPGQPEDKDPEKCWRAAVAGDCEARPEAMRGCPAVCRLCTPLERPWKLFSASGYAVTRSDLALVPRCGEAEPLEVYAVEGGNWIWPGVRLGHSHTVDVSTRRTPRNVTLRTLSLQPLVFQVDGFLDGLEADHILAQAEGAGLKRSGIKRADSDTDYREGGDARRSSDQVFLTAVDEVLKDIDRRSTRLLRLPLSHMEPTQVLRYSRGQKYDGHHDFFPPDAYYGQPQMMRMLAGGRKNRMATLFWYSYLPK